MKIFKKIFIGFIVAITILGMVAFYSPIRNSRTTAPGQSSTEDQSASLTPIVSTSSPATSTIPASSDASLEEMPGFSGLGQENDLLKELEASSSSGTIEDIFNELNP